MSRFAVAVGGRRLALLRVLVGFATAAGMSATPAPIAPEVVAAPAPAPQAVPRDSLRLTPTGTASIAGRVVVRDHLEPLPVRRARVTLTGDGLPEPRVTDTDTDGRYRFDNLPAGRYRVRAEKPGFVALEHGAVRPFVQPPPIELGDRESKTADISLPRGAALEGRLVDEAGEPIQDLTVSAMRLAYGLRGRQPVAVGQARTDDLGRFRVHSLPAGTYYLQITPGRLAALDRAVVPGERPTAHAATFFPGTARLDEARTITLAAGQEISQLDFTPVTVPAARVSVEIIDGSGQRPIAASCRLQPVSGVGGAISGYGDPRTPGRFEFPAVPPGEFWLTAAATPAGESDPQFAAMRVTVSGGDLPLMTVRTAPGARIDGFVEAETDSGMRVPAGWRIVADEVDFELPVAGGGSTATRSATVGADGRFVMASLFGPRLLSAVGLPPGWALKAMWLDDQEITDTVHDFRASDTPRMLRVVVTSRTGSIEGTVVGARAHPAGGSRVVVFPREERLWGPRSRFVQSALVSADGRFTFDSLVPGDYLVCAIEFLEDAAWTDAAVLRRLRPLAEEVTVAERAHQSLTLVVKVLR